MQKFNAEKTNLWIMTGIACLSLLVSGCGKSGAKFNTRNGSTIMGQSVSGHGTMTVTATSWSANQDQAGNFFDLSFNIQDNGVSVDLFTESQGNGVTDGQNQQHAGSATYSVQSECLDYGCTQYVALFNAVPDSRSTQAQVAVFYEVDSQGKISAPLSPLWNKNFSSIQQAAAELQTEYLSSSGAS